MKKNRFFMKTLHLLQQIIYTVEESHRLLILSVSSHVSEKLSIFFFVLRPKILFFLCKSHFV